MNRRFSRRHFLGAMGASLAFLPAMRTSALHQSAAPRRVLFVVKSNGNYANAFDNSRNEFWPEGEGEDLATKVLPRVSEVLQSHRDHLLFLEGVNLTPVVDGLVAGNPDHSSWGMLLTGRAATGDGSDGHPAAGPSIDQVIGASMPSEVPVAKLNLGVLSHLRDPGTGKSCISWRDAKAPNIPNTDPTDAFDRFLAGAFGGGLSPEEREAQERMRAQRRSVLDFVGRDLERFSANLGHEHRQQVEAHLESIRQLERDLVVDPGPGADGAPGCFDPGIASPLDPDSWAQFPQLLRAQMELIVTAFACDITRVATLSLGDAVCDKLVFRWLGDDYLIPPRSSNAGGGSVTQYHDITHSVSAQQSGMQDDNERKIGVERWHFEQYLLLLDLLAARPDLDGGSLLDNTAVVFVDSHSAGWVHNEHRLPWIIAGSCGGHFRTGRHVKLSNEPTNSVLAEVGVAMGLPDAPFGDFGGTLPGLRA